MIDGGKMGGDTSNIKSITMFSSYLLVSDSLNLHPRTNQHFQKALKVFCFLGNDERNSSSSSHRNHQLFEYILYMIGKIHMNWTCHLLRVSVEPPIILCRNL